MKNRGILFDYNGVLVSSAYDAYVYPGLPALLNSLSEKYLFGIVSGASRDEIVSVLEQESLLTFFDAIITADDTQRSKPDPEGYLKGIAALGLPAAKSIAVKDSPGGIAAAKAAGLTCIAVQHTLPAEKLSAADAIVSTLADIREKLPR
jgi:sugar-phosphatase